MAYVIHSFEQSTRPVVAIFSGRGNVYRAERVYGFATWRNPTPACRGSENLITPVYSWDFDHAQENIHESREEVLKHHAPYQVVMDADLFNSLSIGDEQVEYDEHTCRWFRTDEESGQ